MSISVRISYKVQSHNREIELSSLSACFILKITFTISIEFVADDPHEISLGKFNVSPLLVLIYLKFKSNCMTSLKGNVLYKISCTIQHTT
jgi:hypothetical protein